MEASKFIKESVRMCSQYDCGSCPAGNCSWCITNATSLADDDVALEKYISIVDKWSVEHPIKTNAKKLEEVFGHEVIKIIRGYAARMTDEEVFREAFIKWLGDEYIEEEKLNGSK